jgi:hypothetical protein
MNLCSINLRNPRRSSLCSWPTYRTFTLTAAMSLLTSWRLWSIHWCLRIIRMFGFSRNVCTHQSSCQRPRLHKWSMRLSCKRRSKIKGDNSSLLRWRRCLTMCQWDLISRIETYSTLSIMLSKTLYSIYKSESSTTQIRLFV